MTDTPDTLTSNADASEKPVVRYEQEGHVVVLTIDRPEARNAVSPAVAQQMEASLDRFEADPDAWVAIITGEGPAFCAGADLKEIAAGNGQGLSTPKGGFAGLVIRERTKPLIAAVTGHALAGGCEILLACDMAIVAEGVKIGVPEVKRSLVAAAGALWRLPRALGKARAAELALTGDPMTPEEALALGMINRVVPQDQVMTEARALAARIEANAPLAVQASLRVLNKAFDLNEAELHQESGRAFMGLVKTEDFAEGPRAFIEKRPPVWKGR